MKFSRQKYLLLKFIGNFGKLDLVSSLQREVVGILEFGTLEGGGWLILLLCSLYLIFYALTFTGSRRCFTVEIPPQKEYSVKLVGESLCCQLKFSWRWGLADFTTICSLYLIIYALTRRCFTVEIFLQKEYSAKLVGESPLCRQLKFSWRSFPFWAGQKPIKELHD